MTEQKHTPEPWKLTYRGQNGAYDIDASGGKGWGDVSVALGIGEANSRRIVACVNACAGLDTEYLETVGLPEFAGKQLCADMVQQELDAVIAERDRLLARVEVAEAGYQAAVQNAEWQARTNTELNAITMKLAKTIGQRDQLRAALDKLYSAMDSCVDLTPEVMWQARAALAATEGV